MEKLSNVKYGPVSYYNDILREVVVSYTLDGVPHHYYAFIREKDNANNRYYLNEAKKKFELDYNSGKIYKFIKIDRGKPWLIAGISVFGAAALALGGILTYKYLTGGFGGNAYQPGQQVKVNAAVEDPSGGGYNVSFTNNDAKVGEAYHTTINLTPSNATNDDYVLPDKLVSVVSNTTTLKEAEYTYTPGENKTTAELNIEGKYVYGPMTVSLVLVPTSQPGPGPEPVPSYTVTLDAGDGKFETGKSKIDIKVDSGTNVLTVVNSVSNPALDNKIFAYYTYGDYTSINSKDIVTGDTTIISHYFDNTDPLEDLNNLSWSTIRSIATTKKDPSKCFALGATKSIVINGQEHLVRIIGFGHDLDKDNNKTSVTFEFTNAISDTEGYSLGSLYNDTNDESTANYNYFNSTIYHNLNDTTEGTANWYTMGGTAKSDVYKNSAWLMLPQELRDVITPVKKITNIYNSETNSWEETSHLDSLFLLTPKEMGYSASFMENVPTYEYYDGFDSIETAKLRYKKPVKLTDYPEGAIPPYIYATITDTIHEEQGIHVGYNYAGYVGSSEFGSFDIDLASNYFWLRSPFPHDSSIAWTNYCTVGNRGALGNVNRTYVYKNALGVAPAFCI